MEDIVPANLIDILCLRVEQQPEDLAYTFLQNGEEVGAQWTYRELHEQAKAIAVLLQAKQACGERVLLLYPPGLEFIAAFWGCLYAGAIAVPAYPPQNKRHLSRIQTIVDDAQASFLLTVQKTRNRIRTWLEQSSSLASIRMFATDELSLAVESEWRRPKPHAEELAFLQYTSGSTASPKGVMVSHHNLLHNLGHIQRSFETNSESIGVSWLPPYHDMGLIGGILQPLFVGFPIVLMSPGAFLQRPLRWLKAISDYRATVSGGPNFAYDLCANKISEEQRDALDLSCWELAFSGAEPVQLSTLKRFAQVFKPCGFRFKTFYPCYGLAEATLFASGGKKTTPPVVQRLDSDLLETQAIARTAEKTAQSRQLVGVGQAPGEQEFRIVDPENFTPCLPGQIGEIWIAGPGVTQGYWKNSEATREYFQAYLAESGEGPFLRTGDLGFLHDGELFVTGRRKDMLIIRGRNYYPHDIENIVGHCHAAIRRHSTAVFSTAVGDDEQLVILAEVERRYVHHVQQQAKARYEETRHTIETDAEFEEAGFSLELDHAPDFTTAISAIRQAVTEEFGIHPSAILLIKATTIPRTSSGKIQHYACKDLFLKRELDIIFEWHQAEGTTVSTSTPFVVEEFAIPPGEPPSAKQIERWLQQKLAGLQRLPPEQVDIREPFARYGLDSFQAVTLSGELEEWLGIQVSPTCVYDYPTIEALAGYLAEENAPQQASVAGHAAHSKESEETIAIIGLGCRFPGAENPEAFWELLRDGVDAITEIPSERWNIDDYYDSTPATPGKMYTRYGGFLKDIADFDAQFFNISPREAVSMDPQQRLLLESAWEALEHAGQAPERLKGSQTGIFIGVSNHDYAQLHFARPDGATTYAGTGNAQSIVANRLSYLLDFRGPSMAIDTACSSSLVAVHQACQSLRRHESNLALAGGVNVMLLPEVTISLSQARFLAPDGRCKTFDASADGYVRGEGCGIIVLKRLTDALSDGDNILALIRGSAINQDGRSNGLTAPNGPSQQAVIRQALYNAKIKPEQISYIEAHGTGTALGDPIEVSSLKEVLVPERPQGFTCWLGSVKTNIGHLESAAGIAGLIKVVLALQQKTIPPHLHFKQLNPHISLDGTSFVIPTQLHPWDVGKERRLAGISSFGFGGSNAHVILEETLPRDSSADMPKRPFHLLTLTAKNEKALGQLASKYAAYFDTHQEEALGNISYSANTGRSHLEHRLAVVADTSKNMLAQLRSFADGTRNSRQIYRQERSKEIHELVWLFTGQGSQYVGMGKELYETHSVFRRILNRCDEFLRDAFDLPLLDILYPKYNDERSSRIHETHYTQPVIFCLEYALAELWKSWGLVPSVLMGHSIGEYAAACLAGIYSLEDGLKLVAERGRLMQSLPRDGKMAAVFAEEDAIVEMLVPYGEEAAIAAVNGPRSLVISGRDRVIEEILAQCDALGVKTQLLTVSHAFHSPLMDPILAEFERLAGAVTYMEPQIPLLSDFSGGFLTKDDLTAAYWARHIREPVRFLSCMKTLADQGHKFFLEIGPKPVLAGMGRQCPPKESLWLPSLRQGRSDWQQMLQSLGQLYVRGIPVDWDGVDRAYAARKVILPTYPFQRQRYFLESVHPGLQASQGIQAETALRRTLQQGDVEQFIQLLLERGEFSGELQKVLPEVVKELVRVDKMEMETESFKNWLYDISWQPKALQETERQDGDVPGTWILLCDNSGTGEALGQRLRDRGERCVTLYAGKFLENKGEDCWVVDPERPADFQRVFQEAGLIGGRPALRAVIYLWGLDAATMEPLSPQDLEQMQGIMCGGALHSLQTVLTSRQESPPRFWFVTRGVYSFNPASSQLSVVQAPLWGVGKVFALEYSDYWGGLLDLDAQKNERETEALLREILFSDGEDQIVFRENQRYVARLESKTLPKFRAYVCKAEASYLISGGLGALGRKVAQWIVEQGGKHLILVSRRGIVNEIQRKFVTQLESSGARIVVKKADVARANDIDSLLKGLAEDVPPLAGIIHAAGVLDDGGLVQQTWERFRQVMAPKVLGAWNLHLATRDMPLDFFVCFSSVASLFGSPGQANYAAANAFLDSLMQERRSCGLHGLSLNWGPWAGEGMAAGLSKSSRELLSSQGMKMLQAASALRVLSYVLGTAQGQLGVFDIQWQRFLQNPLLRKRPFFSEFAEEETSDEEVTDTQAGATRLIEQLTDLSEEARQEKLTEYVQTQLANVIGLESPDSVEIEQGFVDMGLDSLMTLDLKTALEQDLGITLSTTVLFDYPTIQELVGYILREIVKDRASAESREAVEAEAGAGAETEEPSPESVDASIEKELEELESLLGGKEV